MHVMADVYDEDGLKLGGGPVTAIQSASITQQLDGAGTFTLDLATDEKVLTQLVNEAEVRIQVQQIDDDPSEEWLRGIIRDNTIAEAEGGTTITVTGPDTLDILTERTVGIGRSYENETLQTIINALVALVPGWSATIESEIATDLQTARFDGANVLRSLIRVAEEKGIHFRNGLTPNTLEFGAFGETATASDGRIVHAIQPPSTISQELAENESIILIDRISRTSKSNAIVNWCIPIGAGEGIAALTLRDTTYTIYYEDGTVFRAGTASKYPIYRRINDNGLVEYYVDGSNGARLRQAVVAFKEIGSVSNSIEGKQYVANALAQATFAYLDRQKLPLVSYKLSAKNVKAIIRPGHKLRVQYIGRIEVLDETRSKAPRLTYLNVNEDLWVMKVTKKISDGQITHDFDVATVDRYEMDSTRIMVSLMEAMQAKNVSIQSFPFGFQDSSERVIQGAALPSDAQYKPAVFSLQILDIFTDVPIVKLRVITRSLYSMTDVGQVDIPSVPYLTNVQYWYAVYPSPNYPSDITLTINGVDVTAELGGPWNPSGGNSPVNVVLDISRYIVDAPGGLYQDHSIVFAAGYKTGPGTVSTSHDPITVNTSNGIVEAKILCLGVARGIFG